MDRTGFRSLGRTETQSVPGRPMNVGPVPCLETQVWVDPVKLNREWEIGNR